MFITSSVLATLTKEGFCAIFLIAYLISFLLGSSLKSLVAVSRIRLLLPPPSSSPKPPVSIAIDEFCLPYKAITDTFCKAIANTSTPL